MASKQTKVFRLTEPLFAIGLRFDRTRIEEPWTYSGGSYVAIDDGGYLQPGALLRPIRGDVYEASTDAGETWFPQRIDDAASIKCDEVPRIAIGMRVESGEGEDHDVGRVRTISEDGKTAFVDWESGVSTPADVAALREVSS